MAGWHNSLLQQNVDIMECKQVVIGCNTEKVDRKMCIHVAIFCENTPIIIFEKCQNRHYLLSPASGEEVEHKFFLNMGTNFK